MYNICMNPRNMTPYDPDHDVHRITLYSTVAREHQHRSLRKRLYLHLDMNCFYAQVEQRAWNLYGLPLALGGWRKPDGTARGIVATASHEARDRKSTRLNSSHVAISYAVVCLKKKRHIRGQ